MKKTNISERSRTGSDHLFVFSPVVCALRNMLASLLPPLALKKKRKNNHCSVQAIVVTVILTTCTEVTCDVLTTCNIPASAGSLRLRVVPYFSSRIVEQAKSERAWKSAHACRLFSRGEIFTRARVSIAPTIPEEKWGTTRSLRRSFVSRGLVHWKSCHKCFVLSSLIGYVLCLLLVF